MLISFSFCGKDQEQALKNAVYLAGLKNVRKHKFFIGHDSRINPKPIREALEKTYEIAGVAAIKDPYDSWPQSANVMFAQTAREIEYGLPNEKYYLWLEPDAIIVKENGLDLLQEEYLRAKKYFMGGLVPKYVDGKGGISPEHLTGCAIYPNPLVQYAGVMLLSAADIVPFDLSDTQNVINQAHFTDKIQHRWSPPSNPNPPFTSVEDMKSRMTSECVLYHSDKSGSLIDILSESREVAKPKTDGETSASSAERDPTDFVGSNPTSPQTSPVSYGNKQPRKRVGKKNLTGRHGEEKPQPEVRGSRPEDSPKPASLNSLLESVSQHFTSPLAKGRIFKQLKAFPIIR